MLEEFDNLSEVPFGCANRDGCFNRLFTGFVDVEQLDALEDVELVDRGRACFCFAGSFSGIALGSKYSNFQTSLGCFSL